MSGKGTYEEQMIQVLSKLRQYCARQERCQWDIRQKLKKYDLPYSLWDEVIACLIEEDYLDEERYARAYVRGKFRINRWGRYKIRRGLRRKQIAGPNIRIAMEEIDEEEYTDTLTGLIRKKMKQLRRKTSDYWKRRQKLMAYCAQKGYETEVVADLFERITSEE